MREDDKDISSWPTGRLLSVAARLVEARFHDVLAEYRLTHAGMIALHHLTSSPLTQRELARLSRVTDQTISKTIEHLRKVGYVSKDTDARDRRRALITISDTGRTALESVRKQERQSERLLGAVDDYDAFRRQLIKLITHT
ncbi:MarR family winged helix-turn-helix transcriptional regulator [Nonomuraea sp. NPDC050394]|uniref:MarR family winged helix-turn-helix transcriptional regulator n=1 Tax=Nonomuraea sp. NPDC050394 TaxID=3364363 RepID=UPI00379151CB